MYSKAEAFLAACELAKRAEKEGLFATASAMRKVIESLLVAKPKCVKSSTD